MSLRNAKLPRLGDKLEAAVEKKRAKLEKKDDKENFIIKKSAKKD